MKPAIVISTYWAGDGSVTPHFGTYDHLTSLSIESPELDRCLASLEQLHENPPILLLMVCPPPYTSDVIARLRELLMRHPALSVTLVGAAQVVHIAARISEIAPHAAGDAVALRGYGSIRNTGLAIAAILGYDTVVFIDDDEVILGPEFLERACYALNQETRQHLPIVAKSGYFYNEEGSPFAHSYNAGPCHKWWTKRQEFNAWMASALAGTRISRSNYVCGGCMALSARAFMRVAFDPYITRGEDLDYLFNLRLFGYEMWFDNQWMLQHLPPKRTEYASRFMQDVYRWYYEREKLLFAARQVEYHQLTPQALMPYPGFWISDELDQRVRKTALARALLTHEHAAYWSIYRSGYKDAQRYAHENAHRYLQFQSFWPSIMNALWQDQALTDVLCQGHEDMMHT